MSLPSTQTVKERIEHLYNVPLVPSKKELDSLVSPFMEVYKRDQKDAEILEHFLRLYARVGFKPPTSLTNLEIDAPLLLQRSAPSEEGIKTNFCAQWAFCQTGPLERRITLLDLTVSKFTSPPKWLETFLVDLLKSYRRDDKLVHDAKYILASLILRTSAHCNHFKTSPDKSFLDLYKRLLDTLPSQNLFLLIHLSALYSLLEDNPIRLDITIIRELFQMLTNLIPFQGLTPEIFSENLPADALTALSLLEMAIPPLRKGFQKLPSEEETLQNKRLDRLIYTEIDTLFAEFFGSRIPPKPPSDSTPYARLLSLLPPDYQDHK